MAKEKGVFSFSDLNKAMQGVSQWGGLMSEGAGVSEITEHISTGNFMLNAAFSGSIFKGIPNNRSIEIYGPSGTGKTYIMLNMAREAQKKGYFVVWYDSENAIELSQIEDFGCDPAAFRYEPVQTVQEFRTNVTTLVDVLIDEKKKGNEIPKLFVVLDSAGNLATQKEIDDAKAGQEKQDMTRAKVMKSIFRILMSKMGVVGASFVFSNHCYQTLDLFSQQVAAGGTGAEYGASVIMLVNKAKLKDGNQQVGIKVNAKPVKNRFCRPVVVEFNIEYDKGMNPFVGLTEYMKWDICGTGRGKFVTPKEYEKLSPTDKQNARICEAGGETKYFVPSDSGRNVCSDDGNMVPWSQCETKAAWSRDRLNRLDKYIQDTFKYSKSAGVEDLFTDDLTEEPEDSAQIEVKPKKTDEYDVDDLISDQMN